MAINNISPKKGKVVDIPDAPTIGTATAGAESATVAFTAATRGGPAITYTALSSPGSITGTGSSSPVTVSGLTAGNSYTFTVRANNPTGSSPYSSSSNSVTPSVNYPTDGYVSLATQTVGTGGATEITFSSIPQIYKNLQIRGISRGTNAGASAFTRLRINGDSGANYARHLILADGLGTQPPQAYGYTGETMAGIGYTLGATSGANMFGGFVVDILDYQNTNKNKVVRSIGGADNNSSANYSYISYTSSVWLNTNAISSITISQDSGNLAEYSSFALYGIVG